MTKEENRDICKECGGYCCKKCGCDYFVSDLESNKIEYFESLLATGRISVVSALQFHYHPNGAVSTTPTLYLRARNIDRGEIDLLSLKKTCASLMEDGCFYSLENRPSGGATLIPRENRKCYSTVDSTLELINHIYDVRQKQKYFYKEDPTERLAQIKSYSTIVELLKQIGKESSCVLQVEQMYLLKEKIRGYSWKGIYMLPPTLVYLEGTDNIEEWKHFEFYDENNEVLQRKVETKYTLEKRLTLGLPVRKEEYQKVKNSITIL